MTKQNAESEKRIKLRSKARAVCPPLATEIRPPTGGDKFAKTEGGRQPIDVGNRVIECEGNCTEIGKMNGV